MCWGSRQRIDRQLSKLRFVSRLVVVYMKGNLVFYIMYGKFWFHGDFFDRNLDTSWNRSLSQRNFFFSWQNGTLSFFFGPGFFFYQGLVPPFDFSMSKDFSIGKELPGVNFVECAGNIIKFEPSFKYKKNRFFRPLKMASNLKAGYKVFNFPSLKLGIKIYPYAYPKSRWWPCNSF